MPNPQLSLVIAARNDDYGNGFAERFYKSAIHNIRLLAQFRFDFEYILCEWNPLPVRPFLSQSFVADFPSARAVVIEPAIHEAYTLNPQMPFHEMPAKNAGIRRARGDWILVTNADILLDDDLVERMAGNSLKPGVFYRAHRVDVPPHLDWPQLKDPCHQLPSGEGRLTPPYYLGAGGDFALADRTTWLQSTGFNEVIRWTTRAKDWQFFLGVAARGIPIEFIGEVYHLDHAQGFRLTPPEQRDTETAHFGGNWDFEFGIPVTNRDGWGMTRCSEESDPSNRVTTLRLTRPLFSESEQAEDEQWHHWLSPPPGGTDWSRLRLLHGLLYAAATGRRLLIRPESPKEAVAAVGLARVAAFEGMEVSCPWNWPQCGWANLPESPTKAFQLEQGDLLLEETGEGWKLTSINGPELDFLPLRLAPVSPSFNPFLCRRLLRALLRCQRDGIRRIALYGAGGHTRGLLAWGLPDWLDCRAILAESVPSEGIRGIPVFRPDRFEFKEVDAVMLSSVSYENEMLESLSRIAPSLPVIPIYSDWPPGL